MEDGFARSGKATVVRFRVPDHLTVAQWLTTRVPCLSTAKSNALDKTQCHLAHLDATIPYLSKLLAKQEICP